MIDLKNARRDDLIRLVVAQHETIQRQERVIVAQQERIVALEATVAQLTERINGLLATVAALQAEGERDGRGRPQGMPGLKAANGTPRADAATRKRREQQFVRRRMEPTRQVIHALDHLSAMWRAARRWERQATAGSDRGAGRPPVPFASRTTASGSAGGRSSLALNDRCMSTSPFAVNVGPRAITQDTITDPVSNRSGSRIQIASKCPERCSPNHRQAGISLIYREKSGEPGGIRTHDQWIKSPLLYR